ncbi:MAG: malonate transporter subunit MadM [Selenomonadaceae bacterium]
MDLAAMFSKMFVSNGLIGAFIVIGVVTFIAYKLAGITKGRIHGSAVAIFAGLVLAYIGGSLTGGHKGFASIPMFAGVGIMGGGMLRDFAIVSTAFGADLREIKKCGIAGVLSLFIGLITSFVAGGAFAYIWGYHDIVSMATIGAGVATFVVGPVTGAALGASSEVIAISIAAGVVKSVTVMIATPFVADLLGLRNPQAAMMYGGLMGTTSGTAAGMAAVDPKLVPYAAMTATFYTGMGCLLCPSIFYLALKAIMG